MQFISKHFKFQIEYLNLLLKYPWKLNEGLLNSISIKLHCSSSPTFFANLISTQNCFQLNNSGVMFCEKSTTMKERPHTAHCVCECYRGRCLWIVITHVITPIKYFCSHSAFVCWGVPLLVHFRGRLLSHFVSNLQKGLKLFCFLFCRLVWDD